MLTDLADPVEPGAHAVQYYTHPDALVSSVTRYVGGGLAAGETAVVVATPEHHDAFDASLDAAGIDLAEFATTGRYQRIDAAAMLPDFELVTFATTMAPLVEALAADGPVRVYGEMVALLWDSGRTAEALDLEAFWNALMHRVPLTLFCGYGGRERRSISATHSAVVPEPRQGRRHPGRAVRRFEATPRSVPLARAFVTETLRSWGLLAEPAALVVTELATNAFEHGHTRLQVSVSRLGASVRIAVSDTAPGELPAVREVGPDSTEGRGLLLVNALARKWGCDAHERGKTVWAVVDAPTA